MAYCDAPDMHEHLQCSVCLDVFNDPVTTPCGHNFCKTCLTACWVQSQDYRCPYCKGTFIQSPDLKFNVTLKAIVQLFEKNPEGLSTAGEPLSEELQCSICLDVVDNPVTTPCGHSFCDTCLKKCWDNNQNCTCPVCKETFNKRPHLKCNTGLKAIVKLFEKNSGYKREKVMTEYSPPQEREDQEETLVKPSVMASSTDILFKDLQCSVDPDLFNNPLIACACGHNFKTCLLEISQDCDCPYCKENISEIVDLREMVQFWPHSEICRCQSSEAKPGLYEKVLNIKQVIMIELSENINRNICKKHEAILELFCRGRADNEKHKRNLELFSKDFQTCVYLFCTEGDHRAHNTLPVESAEIMTHTHVQHIIQVKKIKEIKHSVEPSKGVEQKMSECLPGPPTTGRKRRRESIDIPPFMASCEAPVHEHLQFSVCLNVFNDPVTNPYGHNLCKTCLTVCWEHSQEYRCPSFLPRPDLKFNVVLKEIVQLFKKNQEGLPDAESTPRALGEPHS
ncbi:TNF receptor-associated factor 5 isoform X2 [Triplophysa dalaica]|nr:TNF receptor-associated factor 5 isoform X2 [Triplophysa dalaica]XP_056607969.1 TNF receptor-associated factor 5 isoform X2 [Triplophysa dalaica]